MPNTTTLRGIEQGRADYAYQCAKQNLTMTSFVFNSHTINFNKLFKDAFKKKFEKHIKDHPNDERLILGFVANVNTVLSKDKNTRSSLEKRLVEYYEKYGKEYKAYAKKIPMLIKTNGLGATYAFMKSKGKQDGTPYHLLYDQTRKWLEVSQCPFIVLSSDLVEDMITMESNDYRAVTNEVISFFTWLRRFAEGLIEGDDEQID